jgi:hypothetical protein
MTDKDNNNSNWIDLWLKLEREIAKQILFSQDDEKKVLELGKTNWSSNITAFKMVKEGVGDEIDRAKIKEKGKEKNFKDAMPAIERMIKISKERKEWTAKRWIDWAKIKEKEK